MKADSYAEFQALPAAVQKRVLKKNRDWNTEHDDWWDYVYSQFREDMKAKGISVDRIQFSGFWSQGDGASFNGDVEDFSLFISSHECLANFQELAEHNKTDYLDLRASWDSRSTQYCHSNTLRYSFDNGLTEPDEDDYDSPLLYQVYRRQHEHVMSLIESFEDWVETVIKEHCDDLYKQLEEEYDHLTSDEAIVDNMLANESLQDAIDEAVEYLGLEEKEEEGEDDEQQTTQEHLA